MIKKIDNANKDQEWMKKANTWFTWTPLECLPPEKQC